ncbi:glycosyl transferase family 1 [Stella humosa]|uniref:Glycosyl transferase family 1 n=1 Tax=Stella humosa TaxID=94 RepID=A0A3N1KXX3_9PROT|nr:glycosyltransferase family 4 protein [Stella humosa]ROP83430.1 glycosyl transferase family 1 [Stella humosa]BBK33298.1 hypothetical protein STHU_39320 [Stella humosa]
MTVAATFFHPQLYEVPGAGKPFGATVASSAFLAALARDCGAGPLPLVLAGGATAAQAEATLAALGAPVPVAPTSPERAGLLHLPNPSLAQAAWDRHRRGGRAYSLTGVTHAIASLPAFEALAALVTAPVMPWDALVCPSQSVRRAVEGVLAGERDYLAWRLGGTPAPPLPQLPVIPLGVDVAALARDDGRRADWRQRLGVVEADVVLLYVGRLSAERKANPLPLHLAAEGAARRCPGRRLVLVQAGWFADAAGRRLFEQGAAEACPSVRTVFLDGRDPAVRAGIWSAADIFISLVDNVQETFGLTPLEAMAAGLPVVASDWNGYRETVRDGVDGLLVPTTMPAAGGGAIFTHAHEAGHLDLTGFLGAMAATVAVDADAAAVAIATLAADPARRRQMAAAARARAAEHAWPAIVARYRTLWADLDRLRRSAPQAAEPPRGSRPDIHKVFAHYPTRTLAPGTMLRLAAGVDGDSRRRWAGLPEDERLFLAPAERARILAALAVSPETVAGLAALLPHDRRAALLREAGALLKLGIVEVA